MKLADIPLKLGQPIYVASTLYAKGDVIKLEQTTVKDVVVRDDWASVHLGEGNWGACPSRRLEDVVHDADSFWAYWEVQMAKWLGDKTPEPGRYFYRPTINMANNLATLRAFVFAGEEESLTKGHRKMYRGTGDFGEQLTIPGEHTPQSVFLFPWEEAEVAGELLLDEIMTALEDANWDEPEDD